MFDEQISYEAYVNFFSLNFNAQSEQSIKVSEPSNVNANEDEKPELLWEGEKDRDFFTLTYQRSTSLTKKHEQGWKFHISIDDAINDNSDDVKNGYSNNLARGWNIVKDVLVKYEIYHAKAVKPGCNFSTDLDKAQHGKQITTYQNLDARADNPIFWGMVLAEIESALIAAKVKPCRNNVLNKDLKIPSSNNPDSAGNSQYCSCRNDFGVKSKNLWCLYLASYLKSLSEVEQQQYAFFESIELSSFQATYRNIELNLHTLNPIELLAQNPNFLTVDLACLLTNNKKSMWFLLCQWSRTLSRMDVEINNKANSIQQQMQIRRNELHEINPTLSARAMEKTMHLDESLIQLQHLLLFLFRQSFIPK